VFAALVIQHAKRLNPIIVRRVACLAVPYFSTYFHKWHFFRKRLLNVKCVFWYSPQLLSKKFPTLRIIQRNIITNVYTSSCKVRLFLLDFNENWNFSTDFRKILAYKILQKMCPVVAELFHADVQTEGRTGGRTDRHDDANSSFSQF